MLQITQLFNGGCHLIHIRCPELIFQFKDALLFILFADPYVFRQRGDDQVHTAPLPVDIGEL